MKPCTWCTRATQVTCPECEGTGFKKVASSNTQHNGEDELEKLSSNQQDELHDAIAGGLTLFGITPRDTLNGIPVSQVIDKVLRLVHQRE